MPGLLAVVGCSGEPWQSKSAKVFLRDAEAKKSANPIVAMAQLRAVTAGYGVGNC
ncbi:MAG TPA: hypothetical protein VGN72_15940 [Tepidisphaeraceae bacterium]|nr:hypothetical protein [Tepidisphaeraceae bacterium]